MNLKRLSNGNQDECSDVIGKSLKKITPIYVPILHTKMGVIIFL